jgi:hypothetical protein
LLLGRTPWPSRDPGAAAPLLAINFAADATEMGRSKAMVERAVFIAPW